MALTFYMPSVVDLARGFIHTARMSAPDHIAETLRYMDPQPDSENPNRVVIGFSRGNGITNVEYMDAVRLLFDFVPPIIQATILAVENTVELIF